jgi:hypothetical protein
MLYSNLGGEMGKKVSSTQLAERLRKTSVMTMAEIQKYLGDVSEPTAYRRLNQLGYRRSYNHNGKYYTIYEEIKYDELGLYSCRGFRFSRDGNLTATTQRLVRESEHGYSQRELQEILGVRVQNTLQALVERSQLHREKSYGVWVYYHPVRQRRRAQIRSRERHIEELRKKEITKAGVPLEIVIEVLLTLIRHPGSDVAAVSRRLEGRAPPISTEQIRWVFDRYQLNQKGGSGS